MTAIIIDTETTGIDEPGLIEVAWLQVDHQVRPASAASSMRFNPGKAITWGAMATHHIRDEDVANCPPCSECVVPRSAYWIGHNIDFDWKVLGSPDVKRICTLALARRMWPEMDSHRLGACLYRVLGAEARPLLRNAHSAEADVRFCAAVLGAICKARQPADLEALWQMSEQARIPTHMTFGKHKGAALRDVPRDYIGWLLRQPDIDPYLAQALRAPAR